MTSNQYVGLSVLGVLAVIVAAAGYAYWHFQNASDAGTIYRIANVAGRAVVGAQPG